MRAPEGWTVRHAWDGAGNQTALSADLGSQGSQTTAYTYDARGQLATVNDARGGVYTYSYDAVGRQISQSYPNGVVTTFTYDDVGRMLNLHTEGPEGAVFQDYTYTFDPTGNRLTMTEQVGTVRAWEYDDLYRLTRERVSEGDGVLVYENAFSYDPVGNRLRQDRTDSEGTTISIASAYDVRDRLLSETLAGGPTTTYGWDANGNLTSRTGPAGVTNYGWDAENRLDSVDQPDGMRVVSTYNADGVRVAAALTPGVGQATAVTRYVTDTSSRLSQVIAEVTDVAKLSIQYTRGNQLLSFRSDGQERYVHADHIGSVRHLSDSTASVADAYTYEAFGHLLDHQGSAPKSFLFAGEQRDVASGLDYLRNRWLAPSQGQFVSSDPSGDLFRDFEDQHRYLYARGNPVNRIDPSGLTSLPDVSAALSQLGSLANMTFRVLSILDKLQTTLEWLTLLRRFFGLVMSGEVNGFLTESFKKMKNPTNFKPNIGFEISDVIDSLAGNQGRIARAAFPKWFRWSSKNWGKITGYGIKMPTPIGTQFVGKQRLPEKFDFAGKPFFLILGGKTGGTITGFSAVVRLPGRNVRNIWRMDFHKWNPRHREGGNPGEIDAWRDVLFHFHVEKPPR